MCLALIFFGSTPVDSAIERPVQAQYRYTSPGP